MPQFYAEHALSAPEFLSGYMQCAEWLWPEAGDCEGGFDRSKVRGWSRDAIKSMKADCRAFVKANAADLALYCEVTGRDMESAGHDFFLTREGHGAGFWDRGDHECLTRLTDASHRAGSAGYPWLSREWVRID